MRIRVTFFISLAILLLTVTRLFAQDTKRLRMGVDFGASTYFSDMRENSAIRATTSAFIFDNSNNRDIETGSQRYYTGVKFEFVSANGYRSIITGIRYTQIISNLERDDFWFDNAKSIFYVLYKQDGVNSYYAKATKVSQRGEYVGVPVELRLFANRERFCRFFVKLGVDFNFRVGYKNHVRFLTPTMNTSESDVASALGEPAKFLSAFSPAVGLKFGHDDKMNVNLEINAPAFILSNRSSTLVTSKMGTGIQLYMSFPLK